MNKKLVLYASILCLVFLVSIGSVLAQKGDADCMQKPSSEGAEMITSGIMYILGGGMGPIVVLVIAFVVGFLISHFVWSTF